MFASSFLSTTADACLQIEKDVYVEMSGRQGIQYWDTVKSVSKSDVKSALAPSTGQESSYRYLYNIIMHLRKVCPLLPPLAHR